MRIAGAMHLQVAPSLSLFSFECAGTRPQVHRVNRRLA
jgi:hypothetical protein